MSYPGYPDPILYRVKKNPSVGEFSNIQDALDAITDNSATRPYQILVDPGVWVVSSTLYMKPFVLLVGSNGLSMLTWDGPGNTNMIQGCYDTALVNMQIGEGVTGSGYAFFYDGTSSDPANTDPANPNQSFTLIGVQFGSASNLGLVDGSTNYATVTMTNCSWGGASSFDTGFEVVGGTYGRINVRSSSTVASSVTSPYPDFMFKVHGQEAHLVMSDVSCETGDTSGIGIWVYNGGNVRCSGSLISGFETGVYAELTGAPPAIYLSSDTFYQNTVDLDIEHTSTTGNFTGISAHLKINCASPNFSWGYLDSQDGQFEITSSLGVTFDQGTHTEVMPLIENLGVGLISGGDLTNPGGLFVSVSDLRGYYINAVGELAFAELSDIPNLPLSSSTTNYIFVDTNGQLTASTSPPALSTTILLGRVITTSTGILLIDDTHVPLTPTSQNYGAISQNIFGALYVSGSIVTAGTGPLKFSVTDGDYYVGANHYTPEGGVDCTFTSFYRNASPGEWISVSGQTAVSSLKWDDGSGTLANITVGRYVKHTLYLISSPSGVATYALVYGQEEFTTSVDAEVGNVPTPPGYFLDAIVPIASFVVLQGATSFTTILSERPFPLRASSATAVVNHHAGLVGLTTGNAGHTQFLMLSGTTPMTGSLNMGNQAITNVNTVDGVDVSSHASRHLPLGADALTTAAPTTSVSSTSTNAVGIANSLARSDHSHALDVSSFITQTLTNGVTDKSPSENVVFDALALKLDANTPITGATKTKITYDADGLVTGGANATTADIPDSSNARYVTDAQLSVLGNTSGTNTGDNATNSSTTYVGTTAIALNRSSAAQALTGITSIDGSAATLTTARTINGVSFNGSANIVVTADPTAHGSTHNPGGTDAVATAAAGAIAVGDASAVGVASSLSRSDHTHALTAPAAPETIGTANSTGVATTVARADHVHAHGNQTSGTLHAAVVAAGASGFMTGADKTKLDGIASSATNTPLTASAPANVSKDTAAVGVSTQAARADHKHDITTAAPSTLSFGGSNVEGTSTSLARADHVHQLPSTPPGGVVSFTQVVGVTSSPTNTTSNNVLIPEMTITFTPTSATNRILVDFCGTFSNSTASAICQATVFVDDVADSNAQQTATSAVANAFVGMSIRKSYTLSAAPHTITVQYRRGSGAGGGVVTAVGVGRVLSITEFAT